MSDPGRARAGIGVRLTGVVLAGGGSVRLGTPKPLVMLGGQMVIARIATVLRRVCDELVMAVAQGQSDDTPDAALALGMHVVQDRYPDAGPLAGLEAGLRAVPEGLAFVTAADHPFPSVPLIRAMAQEALDGGHDAVVPEHEGRLQPMHALYSPAVWRPLVTGALDRGETSLYRLLGAALEFGSPVVRVLPEEEVRRHDPALHSMMDIDTPDRLQRARLTLGTGAAVRPDIRRGGL
ncbi:MAG: molybdenum cofactor guanylyltransferase [Chloroflexota bacterium]